MIHVLNPYQLSTSMYRLAAYGWEAQVTLLKVVTHLATSTNPMFVTRERILKAAEAEAPVAKVAAPKPAKPRAKAAPAAPEIVEAKAEPVVDAAEPKKYRAPSKPPAMPKGSAAE